MIAIDAKKQRIRPLVEMLDQATSLSSVEQITARIKSELCRLIRTGAVSLSPEYRRVVSGRYARRLLHQNDRQGYSVVVMTWGPKQSTPVHDHAGMWCVEGVWEGHIDVEQYELTDQTNDKYCFEKRNSFDAGVASAGCLIPPFEYHRISNNDPEQLAVTIHIYGGEMTHCNVFEQVCDTWYCRRQQPLKLDDLSR